MNESYQQSPGESVKAFQEFRCYLALGVSRSIFTLAKQLGLNEALLERWSKRWNWTERIQVGSPDIAHIQGAGMEGAVRDEHDNWARPVEQLKELEWSITLPLLDRARQILQTPDSAPSTRDACLAVELASKIGRLASDLGNADTEATPSRNEISPLFAATLHKVYGPALNPENPPPAHASS